MFRKLVGSMAVMLVGIGFATADDFIAVIKKVDGDKVTFAKTTKKGKAGEDQTMPAAGDVTVNRGTPKKGGAEKGDPIDGGLKADIFKNIGEKGINAFIKTDADNKKINEIIVFGKKGK